MGSAKPVHVAKSLGHQAEATRSAASRPILGEEIDDGLQDTRFEKTEDAVDMTAKLIERRRREVRRRQFAGYPGCSIEKRSRYLASVIRKLAQQVESVCGTSGAVFKCFYLRCSGVRPGMIRLADGLIVPFDWFSQIPTPGKRALCEAIRSYASHRSSPEQFFASMQEIVDEFGAVVPLHYTPEHHTRAPASPSEFATVYVPLHKRSVICCSSALTLQFLGAYVQMQAASEVPQSNWPRQPRRRPSQSPPLSTLTVAPAPHHHTLTLRQQR